MVRLAEILANGLADAAIEEALQRTGNRLFEKNAETLSATPKEIKLEEPDPLG